MDTYFNVSFDCKKCGRCVTACKNDGQAFLDGGRGVGPIELDDYVPCHHCKGAPCIDVCHYNCIKIGRY